MVSSPKIRYLEARKLPNGSVRYYARVRVPKDLERIYHPAREIKKSLQTSDRQKAQGKLHEAVFEIRFEFELKRKMLGDDVASSIDKTTMRRITRRYFAKEFETIEPINIDDFDEDEFGQLIDNLEEETNSLRYLHRDWLESVQLVVNGLLAEHRINLGSSRSEYFEMCDYVRRAFYELKRRELAKLKGSPGRKFDTLFDGAEEEAENIDNQREEDIEVGYFISLFNASQGLGKSAKKQLEYGMVYQLMKDHLGERTPLKNVRRSHVRAIKDTLEYLPPNSTKRFKSMSFVEAAEHAKVNNLRPLSSTTANGYLQKISTMFKWAIQEEYVDHNPAVKMKVDTPIVERRSARLPFSNQQLTQIFSSGHFASNTQIEKEAQDRGGKDIRDEKFWIPLIALFSGMRMNEICQLECGDVLKEDGINCFFVQDSSQDGEKKIKSEASRRIVPIHSELLKIGFVDYWSKCKEKSIRLFPNLKKDSRGYYSGSFQKWFGRYLNECGAKAPKTSFHSFRHKFRDALREAEVSIEAVDSLCGWTGRGMQYQYGSSLGVEALAKHIEKVRYQELDLSHLYREC